MRLLSLQQNDTRSLHFLPYFEMIFHYRQEDSVTGVESNKNWSFKSY
jgi:hypothetical protein